MTLIAETEQNYKAFLESWTQEAAKNWNEIHKSDRLLLSYRRISAVQGLKVDLLADILSKDSLNFFNEAHNDALVSHISASLGAWRLSLQSLRSFLENSLCALYYSDHPIELKNWERGKKKIGFTDLVAYFSSHPALEDVPTSLDGMQYIKDEYKTLSLAVHSSAKDFRMTDDVSKLLLWSTSKDKIGKWSSREGACFVGVALLIVTLNRSEFLGSKKTGLRTALSFIMGSTLRSKLKSEYKITIQVA